MASYQEVVGIAVGRIAPLGSMPTVACAVMHPPVAHVLRCNANRTKSSQPEAAF